MEDQKENILLICRPSVIRVTRLMTPKSPSESATEMVQVVLPNDANPLGFMLGGAVMHLIDIAGAITALRHARTLMVTAAVDGLEFLNPIRVGDFIVLKARVSAAFTTSLEVEVQVFSEHALTGQRQKTSRAYLTFVTLEQDGVRAHVPPLAVETDDDRRVMDAALRRRAEHLARRQQAEKQY